MKAEDAPHDLRLSEFEPGPELVVPRATIDRPRYPVIDAHNHLDEIIAPQWASRGVRQLLDLMDELRIQVLVDLVGWAGSEALQTNLDRFKARAPERFAHFGGVAWNRWSEHGDRFGEWAAARLVEQARWGAQGLKVWKSLGLSVRDQSNRLVTVDDPRLDALWSTAGELKLPVVIHVADPVAFFKPRDRHNERWDELADHPEWHVPSPPHPSFDSLLGGMERLVLRHPGTTFVGAHVGCYPENLAWVGRLLDRAHNFHVDIGNRISELGRQPYSSRRFFRKYSDRILFGTDCPPDREVYRLYYRFLETDDEYFEYYPAPVPNQGRWRIYGIFLEDDVLERVYALNARRILRLATGDTLSP